MAVVAGKKLSDHLGIIGSSMAGLLAAEFVGEYTAKATGKTGWDLAWIKLIAKGGLGGALIWLSTKMAESKYKEYLENMGYTCIASWILDALFAAYPGGIPGIAAALTLRRAPAAVAPAVPTMLRAVSPSPLTPLRPAPPAGPAARIVTVTPTPTAKSPGAGAF
jgi:hypothetical protein